MSYIILKFGYLRFETYLRFTNNYKINSNTLIDLLSVFKVYGT